MSNPSKASSQARDTQVIAALAAHFGATATFQLGGKVYKTKELQQLLQNRMTAAQTTGSARTKWLGAVAAEQQVSQEADQVLLGLKHHLLATYGAQSQIVADFGFTPKTPMISPDVAAAAVEKRRATRKARGTMGKKQKAKITGANAPVVAAPASAAPEQPPAPAKPVTAS